MGLNNNIPIGPVVKPVPTFTCEIPMSYTPEDNLTYINKLELDLVECPTIPLNTSEDWWNCNLCGSDEHYEQPVIDGDVIRLQIRRNNNLYTAYYAYLFDNDGEIIEDTGIETFLTSDGFLNNYLNIKITVTNVPAECFHMRLYGITIDVDSEDLAECIGVKVDAGNGPKESQLLCLLEFDPNAQVFFSELYRKTNADCENTLWIEGEYTRYDCNKAFYGVPQLGTDVHTLGFRVPGTIEKTDIGIEETIVFNRKRTSKQSDTYLLRTEKIPPYVAEQIALAFNSRQLSIDGVDYFGANKLSKNFEDGQMWIISTPLRRDCDERDFLCL